MNYPGLAEASSADLHARRLSLVVIGAMSAVALFAFSVRLTTVPVHGILPLVMGFIIVTELISATLFFSLVMRSRLPAAAFAAAAYLLSTTLAFPYLLYFPNVFGRGVPFGGTVQDSFAFWIAWHAGYALALIGYALTLRYGQRDARRPALIAWFTVAAVFAFDALVIVFVLRGGVHARLIAGNSFTPLSQWIVMPSLCVLDLIALAVLWACTRLRSALHAWLAVAIYASLLDIVLGILSPRYTSGWYTGKFLALVSSATMVLLFLSVFSRMYRDAIRAYDELGRAREIDAELREKARAQQARVLSQAGSYAKVGAWEYDPRSGEIRWSNELYEMFALPRRSVISRETYVARVHPDDRVRALALFDPAGREPKSFAHRFIAGDGSIRTIEGRAEFMADPHGEAERWFGTVVDRTEHANVEQRLIEALERDPTTGLPNRAAARNHIGDLLARRTSEEGQPQPFAVLALDVDRMKIVNDALGHVGGDRYLEMLGKRLQDAAAGAFVGRSSGDEFLILLERSAQREDVMAFSRRLLKAASIATIIFGREFALSVSIGIALFPIDGVTADELIRCADFAMYEAKASGRNTLRFFSTGMRDERIENAVLEGEIRTALKMQQFHLEYQPIVDARSGALFGAEALLRWMHPTRGPVSPQVVVDIAERSGLMGRLGAWVLREGIRQRSLWARGGFTMTLNVSASQLQNQDFTLLLGRMLASSGVSPAAIELEVTESAAMEGALVADQMSACLSMGVHFALDDFGTYYSSISYLQRLAVDRIKIDRSFVRELPHNERDAAIVRALIQLAHNLGRTVIAEGVEDQRQLAWLRDADCDYVQGYAIARPMTAAAFERWMALPGNGVSLALQSGAEND